MVKQPHFVKDVDEFKEFTEGQGAHTETAAFTRIGDPASTQIVLEFATTTLLLDYPQVKFLMVTSTAGSSVFEYAGVKEEDAPRFLIYKDGHKVPNPDGDITSMEQLRERLATVVDS